MILLALSCMHFLIQHSVECSTFSGMLLVQVLSFLACFLFLGFCIPFFKGRYYYMMSAGAARMYFMGGVDVQARDSWT